jgi:hypothetical protein
LPTGTDSFPNLPDNKALNLSGGARCGPCNSLASSQDVAILLHMIKEPSKEKQVLALARKAKILRVQLLIGRF